MNCPSCHNPIVGTPAFCQTCGTALPVVLPADPLIGRTLAGRFKILKLLGEGGMGAVYLGEQMLGTTARKVAIKTLHSHLSRDPSVRARFNREVGTLAGLTHPNTVQVFDFGTTDDGLLYIAMEFVQGKSLSEILEKEGPMKADRVAHVVTQICGSLAEAHAQGIIHRDLKPDNVVLTDRVGQKDVVKVLDFGIAKRSGEEDKNEPKLTQQGMVLGTPPYMSPEQFTGQPLDARSDIYSLAIMVYELLTGKLPFEAGTAFEWATLHMTAAPKAIEAQPNGALLPESMRGAIMKALSKDPGQRFSSVNEFLDRFTGKTAATAMEIAQRSPTAAFGPKGGVPEPVQPVRAEPAYVPFAAGPSPQGQTQGPFAATPDAGADQKGRTQIGEPVAIPAEAFSPGPPMMAPYPAPAANPYSHATPGGVPQQVYAPQSQSGGGNRGLLVGVIALVGVLSAAALGFGVWHSTSGDGGKEVPIEATPTPPPTTPTPTTTDPTPATVEPAPLPGTPNANVLHNTPAQPAHPTNPPAQPAHPTNPPAQPAHPTNPPAQPPVQPQQPPAQPPVQPQQPPVQPQQPPVQPQQPPVQPHPPAIEPAACIQAKAVPKGTPTWNRLASQCRAAGGNPG